MLRNKLNKWKAVAFRNLENKSFASISINASLKSNGYSTLINESQKSRNSQSQKSSSLFTSGRGFGIGTNKHYKLYSTKLPPHEIILMPALSPTMTAGNIGTFHKKVGDALQAGDVLCEIETDKAQMDFEVQEEGFLAKILISEGTKEAQVGKPLAIIVTKKEDVEAFSDYTESKEEVKSTADSTVKSSESTKATEGSESEKPSTLNDNEPSPIQPSTTPIDTSRVKASPLAKRLANEKGIELNNLKGSGPNGRIIKNDILNVKSASTEIMTSSNSSDFVDLPLSNMRRVIASRLTQSKQDLPHYYLNMNIEMDKILNLRAKFNSNPLLQDTLGTFKLSLNDFIVKAAALALKKVPECNSAWNDTFIRQYSNVDICVAVATPAGLITPIITEADKRGLISISGRVKELASKAKVNKLKPEEYQGGTFTISNLGMYGVDSFTAIINAPQSCILAVGATKQNSLTNTNSMTVTLSCDHRVVDGATGAQWLVHFKRFLEEPEQMIL